LKEELHYYKKRVGMNTPNRVRMKDVLLPRDGIGSTMDMDRKGCTLEKVAFLIGHSLTLKF